jgi:hypothetical protein
LLVVVVLVQLAIFCRLRWEVIPNSHLFLRLVVGAVLVTGRRLVQIRQQAAGLVAAAGRMSILLVPLVTHHLEVHHKEILGVLELICRVVVEAVLGQREGMERTVAQQVPGMVVTEYKILLRGWVQHLITVVVVAVEPELALLLLQEWRVVWEVEDKVSAEIVLLGQMELQILGAVEAVLVAVRLTVALQEQVSTAALA